MATSVTNLSRDLCQFCGDQLISFVEELEDGRWLYVTICPSCYRVREFASGVPSND
jgi:hypothetical protein